MEKLDLQIASKRRKKSDQRGNKASLVRRNSSKRLGSGKKARAPRKAIEENEPLDFSLELQTDHPWFGENGIPEEIRAKFGLGFCHRGTMKGRIAFPVQSEHGVLGYVGLWPDESLPDDVPEWLFPKPEDFNPRLEIFGLHECGEVGEEGIEVVSSPLEVILAATEGIEAIHFLGGAVTSHQAIKLVSKFS